MYVVTFLILFNLNYRKTENLYKLIFQLRALNLKLLRLEVTILIVLKHIASISRR